MKYIVNSLLYRNYNFRLLYLGQFTSFIGTMMTGVVLPYQIYQQTHSTLIVGLLGLFQLLPLLITALIGGVMADRYSRRKLLLITEILLTVGCLLLAWNATLHTSGVFFIFVIASCVSAVTGFHRPALESMAQQMVDKKDYPSLSALNTFKFSFVMIAGPAIGGLLIAHYGVATTLLFDFFTYLISLITLLMMSVVPNSPNKVEFSAWRSLRQGFQYAISRQELVGSYVIDFMAMIFGMPNALFPAIAENYGGAKVLGMLYAAPAVGALVASLWSGWAKRIKRYGASIAVSAGVWGIAIILFGLATNLWLALFFMSIAGAADAVSGVFRGTLWNETITNDYRGRLAGIEMLSYLSGPRLGDTEAGLVAALFGVTTSVVSGGILCILSVALCTYWLPKFWRYRSA